MLSKGYPVEHESDNYATLGVSQLQSVTEFAPKSPFLFVQEPYPAMVFVKGLKGGKLSGRSMKI